jgi:hypothetical protein
MEFLKYLYINNWPHPSTGHLRIRIATECYHGGYRYNQPFHVHSPIGLYTKAEVFQPSGDKSIRRGIGNPCEQNAFDINEK